jgi:hypothetical protein
MKIKSNWDAKQPPILSRTYAAAATDGRKLEI